MTNIQDSACGGPPQLAGIYRGDFSKTFGILINHRRYVIGLELEDDSVFGNVEWRNELFERCSPVTKAILPGAQKQPKV